jgi:transposase InsO family protein
VATDPAPVNVTAFCRSHGVSTWFFWDLRRRHARFGDVVLEPAPPVARRVANKTALSIEDEIVRMRKHLVEAGLDAGPATIAFHLQDLPGLPSTATIWRILRARGFIVPEPHKAPKSAHRRFEAERANECWQLDDTSWELADGTTVKILNILDDHSRLAVASRAMVTCTGTGTLAVFTDAATALGWPERFQSDNAKAFRDVLANALAALGITAGHSRPYHPQTNGKVERFHLTLKRWLARQRPATTISELQDQLDLFRLLYNHHRPHRSLGNAFPGDVWSTAPKTGPTARPLGTATEIHHVTIHNGGCHIAKRYDITVGAAYTDQPALAVITGTNCHIFINGQLIRALTLDPTRRRQPLYNRPGRPTHQP